MSLLIGQQVKTESGAEGTIVAVDHQGGAGGLDGWQLLIVNRRGQLEGAAAQDAVIVSPDANLRVG